MIHDLLNGILAIQVPETAHLESSCRVADLQRAEAQGSALAVPQR